MKNRLHFTNSNYVSHESSPCATLLRAGIVALTLVISSSSMVSAGDAPSFLQVNKSYSGSGFEFTVLEIGKDGWIKVVLRERNQLAWINTNATPMIAPYPAIEMNAPAAAPWQ